MAVTLVQLLQLCVKSKGSDLHLAVKAVPMVRINGDMNKISVPPMTAQDMDTFVNELMSPTKKEEFLRNKSVDFSYQKEGVGVFRANVYMQRHGVSIVMRLLTETPPTLEKVNAPPICERACNFPNGLVLVCGPTGSGKSTTLAAMLDHINSTCKSHILTLEDPIEFLYDNKMCLVNQRGMGVHFTDFASALKAAMREDPDVILVGEMRDAETIALALKAAETGHLVFSTLHTNSAAKTIDRIINSFPSEEQAQVRTTLSETLRVVIAQKLIPAMDKKGRHVFHDILVNTPAVANLIREGKTYQIATSMQTGKADGMQVLDKMLLDAIQEGKISGEDAWEQCNDKNLFATYAPKAAPLRQQAAYVASTGSFIVDQARKDIKSAHPGQGTSTSTDSGQASSPQVKPVVKKIA